MEQEPRHFWRRIFAFLIDIFLTALAVFFLYLPLTALFPNQFAISSGPITTTTCITTPVPPKAFIDITPANFMPEGVPIQFKICETTSMFFVTSYVGSTIASYEPEGDTAITNHTLTFSSMTDADGTPIPGNDYQDLLIFIALILAIAALLSVWSGRTIGKKVVSIKVDTDQEPTFKHYVKREALKYLPLVIWMLIGLPLMALDLFFGTISVTDLVTQSPSLIFTVLGIFFLFNVLWYVLPLIRWRGQMPYDRLTGFKVIKD